MFFSNLLQKEHVLTFFLMSENKEIKCVFLGDSGVGKSCILNVYINGSEGDNMPTIGAAYFSKKVKIDSNDVELMIWDTAGQEMYRGLAPMYYRNARIAFITFDISNKKTFDAVSYWAEELRLNANEEIIMCIVGNKCDLEDKRQVTFETAQETASSLGATYFETSAKTGTGVERLFQQSVSLAIKTRNSVNQSVPDQPQPVAINQNEKKKCC